MNEHIMKIGLGDAEDKKKKLHLKISNGIATKQERDEYNLLRDALNTIILEIPMVCEIPQKEEGLDLISKSAKTSCCRPSIAKKSTSRG